MEQLTTKAQHSLQPLDPHVIETLVIAGDLQRLHPQQKVAYYNYRCQQAGLDPAAKPFDLLKLNGKEILYANASCTQQLTQNRNLSHAITRTEIVNDIYMVCVKVTGSDGRSTENMGAVTIANMKGDGLANALMKATTKAIRRAVLAHCGLGMLDETETETIPNVQTQEWQEPVSMKSLDPEQVERGIRLTNEAISALSLCDSMNDIYKLEDSYTRPEKMVGEMTDWLLNVTRYKVAKAERIKVIEATQTVHS